MLAIDYGVGSIDIVVENLAPEIAAIAYNGDKPIKCRCDQFPPAAVINFGEQRCHLGKMLDVPSQLAVISGMREVCHCQSQSGDMLTY
jgi:hypothetical protein